MLNTQYGVNTMLKEGHKHFSGLEEALLKNIGACKDIAKLTKTGLGPNGQKKMVINHIDKIFVTSDAATIMKELEVQHPAAKMIVMAAKMQEGEAGDGTNLVISLAGELLSQAEELVKMGLHPSQIISGYELAKEECLKILGDLECYKVTDPTDLEQVKLGIHSALSSKLNFNGDFFSTLVAEACIKALPVNHKSFNVENIRVSKILGSTTSESFVINGLVVNRAAEGSITRVVNPKIAVYGTPLDPQQGDTKGTVLIQNAQELLNYSKSEEEHAEKIVKAIAESGVNLIIVGGSINELMLHYLEQYKIMIVRIMSKFELKRISRAVGATALASLNPPSKDEMGTCDEVFVREIGSTKVTVIKRDTKDCKLSTIVLRGATQNHLDDIERAIDDGVQVYRSIIYDGRFVPGAGSCETIIATKLEKLAKQYKDLNQYSFDRFAKSFDIIPRILQDNAGLNSNEAYPNLVKANDETPSGVNINNGSISPISELKIYDHLQTKNWAIRLAADAAITILRVDQIIVAKQAGGPKMPQQQNNWDNID